MGHRSGDSDQRSLAIDFARAAAIVGLVIVHSVELTLGFPMAFNPGPGWGTLSERLAQWLPQVDAWWQWPEQIFRWIGWLCDQAVGVFVVITGMVLTLSTERRDVDFSRRGELRSWWGRHYGRLAGPWLIANGVLLAVVTVVGRDPMSVTDPEFWITLAGVRVTPETLYYAVPAWWYVGLLVQIYLVFPAVLALCRRLGPWRTVFMTIPVFVVIRAAGLLLIDSPGWVDLWARGGIVLTRMPELLLGVATGLFMYRNAGGDVDHWVDTRLWGLRWYAIAAASWILGVVAGFSLLGNAVAPALVAASIMVILVKASPLRQRNRIVSWMASRSFCIYLVHQPVFVAFLGPVEHLTVGTLARMVLALVVTLIAADVLLRVAVIAYRSVLGAVDTQRRRRNPGSPRS